ncbi:MAG TPA: cupredoxin domain-containing protein [Acidimicrobiales bacterium]|jgi:plastocyanin|nr:cupredoxin domain-containing protein [Acidimicrobiales bacterium]
MPKPSRLIPILLAVVVLLAACGSSSTKSSSGPTGSAGGNTIVIKNFAFSPQKITVAPGATVTVHNEDGATHTVTGNGGAFDTGNISGGATKTFTAPTKAGSYGYICNIHQYMTGTLAVS